MKKKGAISLPINFMVILILSLVILGLGVKLMYSFIDKSEQLKTQLDQKTEMELQRLLSAKGKLVAIALSTAEVERGQDHPFGVGILNVDGSRSKEFKLWIELSKAISPSDEVMTVDGSAVIRDWLLYDPGMVHIEENEQVNRAIMVSVPKSASLGTYIFNVKVFDVANVQYGTTQKINVIVK